MNFTGLFLGFITFISIGLGFFWVIKLEYFVGAQVAKLLFVVGVCISAASLFVPGFTLSAVVGILGGTVIWGATELPDQARRVEAGIFPSNPQKRGRRGDAS